MAQHRHNHVVSRLQIELFALDGKVQCHFKDGRSELIGPRNVAVRKNFYTERLPDGSRSAAFEQAMGVTETEAAQVLRDIDNRWPLSEGDHATLTEYLALQAIRSPAYRDFFERQCSKNVGAYAQRLRSKQRSDFELYVASDRFRFETMAGQIAKMGSLIGSMYWSLIRFSSPRLLSSDHPLAPVPLMDSQGAAVSAIPISGFANTIEFRFPISPDRALLLCWRDHQDDYPVLNGKLHHLKSLNASVHAQAEEHWFHRPGMPTPRSTGSLFPLAFELFADYEIAGVVDSERRRRAESAVNRMIDDQENERMQILRVTKSADSAPVS